MINVNIVSLPVNDTPVPFSVNDRRMLRMLEYQVLTPLWLRVLKRLIGRKITHPDVSDDPMSLVPYVMADQRRLTELYWKLGQPHWLVRLWSALCTVRRLHSIQHWGKKLGKFIAVKHATVACIVGSIAVSTIVALGVFQNKPEAPRGQSAPVGITGPIPAAKGKRVVAPYEELITAPHDDPAQGQCVAAPYEELITAPHDDPAQDQCVAAPSTQLAELGHSTIGFVRSIVGYARDEWPASAAERAAPATSGFKTSTEPRREQARVSQHIAVTRTRGTAQGLARISHQGDVARTRDPAPDLAGARKRRRSVLQHSDRVFEDAQPEAPGRSGRSRRPGEKSLPMPSTYVPPDRSVLDLVVPEPDGIRAPARKFLNQPRTFQEKSPREQSDLLGPSHAPVRPPQFKFITQPNAKRTIEVDKEDRIPRVSYRD